MIREVDLISYLPPVIADLKEINIAMAAENREFVLIWKAADRVLKNKFIAPADEYGLSKFEKLLDICPSADDALEVRRARVQAGWSAALPYTWRMFVQKIREICGTAYPVSIIRESYMVHLEAGIELQWQVESLVDVAGKMLPCNMGIAIKNVLPLDLETPAPVVKPIWFEYRVEYTGEITADGNWLVIHTACMHVLIPFWGGAAYNGKRRYNGTLRYNAKRNYGLRAKIKTVLQLYTEQAVRYAEAVFHGRIQHRTDADMSLVFYYCDRLRGMLHAAAGIRMGLQFPCGETGMSIETKRNVVRYNGMRRYNGAVKYNALYRKEQVE